MGEKVFKVFNYIILTAFSLMALYPFIYVFAASLSNPNEVILGNVWLIPKGFTLSAYSKVMENGSILTGFVNALFYMIVGTAVNLAITICGAYPLSKKNLRGQKILNFLVAFTMWFNAGMIALYLNFKDFNLLDTRTVIIIGFACNAYNFMLMRNYFTSIPEALFDASKIDGANDFQILVKVVLPLSMASLATVGLFYAVDRWNGYMWAMILLNDDRKLPLQVVLKKLIVDMSAEAMLESGTDIAERDISSETVTYATIIISTIPMIVIYPFIQRYFVKGVMVGAVKG